MATTEDIVKQVISTLQEQSRNTEALPQEENAGSVGSFVALKKADNSMVQVPISVIETMIAEKIDETPTTGGGGTGEIADGAVTEKKLSIDVANKLNTAYDKANLADNLFINDGITFIQGALHDEGDIYEGTNFRATSLPIYSGGEKITVNSGYKITKYVFYYDGEAMDYGDVNNTDFDSFELAGTESAFIRIEVCRTDNKAISRNEYPNIVKSFIRKPVAWSATCNMNNFVCSGRYTISGSREATATDNMPILNGGKVEAILDVLAKDNCITQVLTLLNVSGGDGNIYTRTRQDNTWGAWGKLQTNVEVGLINQQQMDALIDNGIYSGILSTTGETFVIICINNYAIAQQAGYGGYISQLKYSVDLAGVVKVETRRRDAYGSWTDWQSIGGGDTSVVNQTTTTATIAPNVLNVWGEVSSLDITLAEGNDNVVNEYMFQFTSGATATTLVLPADIKWLSAPNIQANKTYQVSIINNLGVIGEFSHE